MKNQNELIEKYIDGELSDEERTQVETLIEEDKNFEKEFQLRLNVNHAIIDQDVMKLRENLAEICRNSHQDKSSVIRKLYEKKWHLVAASAAMLVVISSFLILSNQAQSSDDLFNQHYKFVHSLETERGSNANTIDLNIKTGLTHYNNSEFGKAIGILKNYESDILSKFYLGLSYLETKKYDNAIECFQFLLDHNDNLFIDQSRWYKGLCLLKLNKKQEAKTVFETIVSEEDAYKNKAKKILKSL